MTCPQRPRIVAAHEAGHAVVAVALGIRVRAVRITPLAVSLWGYIDHADVPRAMALHECIVAAAGPAADALSGRYTARALKRPPEAWSADFGFIRSWGYSTEERDLLVRVASDMLTGKCARTWRAIAAALEDQDLNAEQLAAIVRGEPLE